MSDPTQNSARVGREPARNGAVYPVDIRRGDPVRLLMSALLFFLIMASYYILRAVREDIGSTHRGSVQFLWTIVFFAMLAVVPAFALVVSIWKRRAALAGVFLFFVTNLVAIHALLRTLDGRGLAWCEQGFYVWISVFGMLVVSIFWAYMVDVFHNEEGKRLFGMIAAGGSLGAIVGSALTSISLEFMARIDLILVAAGLLTLATLCLLGLRIGPRSDSGAGQSAGRFTDSPLTGGVWTGMITVFRSPYLMAIAAFLFLYSMGSTFLYFEKIHLVEAAIIDRTERTKFFARIDGIANMTTIVAQVLLLAPLLRRIGVGATLLARPAVTCIGFLALGITLFSYQHHDDLAPTHSVNAVFVALVAFESVRRAVNFALAKPTREILFTVVDTETKYKSKAFIDTVVYRGSDVLHGWVFAGLTALGLGLGAIALTAVPFAAIGGVLALSLGRQQERLREGPSGRPAQPDVESAAETQSPAGNSPAQ